MARHAENADALIIISSFDVVIGSVENAVAASATPGCFYASRHLESANDRRKINRLFL